ncbi:hypothetical protein EX30DRAFT_368367 [Ascodesmis nigricans]|uniref:Uncharacterized protein n=1 Tax=Ascodesmis nigricans TaxID=341454 RepID=A0A4S2N7I3_9PEZI|nr:hypothetical protein EX30DRAFT_368367 [Ascodesmis nigricans]
MSSSKSTKSNPKRTSAPSGPVTTDPRFSVIHSDPRFAPTKRREAKVKLDSRFASVLTDERFSAAPSAPVDKYGRRVGKGKKERQKEKLKEFYDFEDDEEESDSEESSDEEDEDVKPKFDPARGEGIIDTSSSEDESDEEDEEGLGSDVEIHDQAEPAEDVPAGEVSRRFAVVNLDWDHVRAVDLMKTFSSFASGGKVKSVTIYPSEFGKERMEREDIEGPPREIFTSKKKEVDSSSDDSEDEDEKIKNSIIKEDKGEEFDSAKLRAYQLERLRYYYAVVECDSLTTAKTIYDNCDGAEYEATANFFDLRFIPDDTTFDDEPRDSCSANPTDYRPQEFVTDALHHSKVKLTWDADDAQRKEVAKRAFSQREIEDNELKAYLASSDSEDSEDEKAKSRDKLRAALLGDISVGKNEPKDLEVTFTSGLNEGDDDGKVIDSDDGLTTIEKYVKKERQRKQARKEKAKAQREGANPDSTTTTKLSKASEPEPEPAQEAVDLGFDDPFFDEPVKSKSELKKEAKRKLREEKEIAASLSAAQKAELELLMADEEVLGIDGKKLQHFDMKQVVKAEKLKKVKKNKLAKRKKIDEEVLQDGFEIDVKDPRFSAVFKSHEFAIDPTNPRYMKTSAMEKMMDERRKRSHARDGEVPKEERTSKKKRKVEESDGKDEARRLVESLKRKAKTRGA